MEKRLENFKTRLLKKIDKISNYSEKIGYLNDQFIKADTKQEQIILSMLDSLRNSYYGF
jgi:hypothetical protein